MSIPQQSQESKRLIVSPKNKENPKKFERRHTIAVGLGGLQTQKQKLKAWYDQYSVNNEKVKRRNVFQLNSNFDSEQKERTKVHNKFGHGIAQKILMMYLKLNEEAKREIKRVDNFDFDIFKLRE